MNITFHEFRYILHLKDYDSGVFSTVRYWAFSPTTTGPSFPIRRATAFTWVPDGWRLLNSPSPHCRDEVSFGAVH